MGNDSRKTDAKPATKSSPGRPVHAIGRGARLEAYTLNPCNEAFEKEYAAEAEQPTAENKPRIPARVRSSRPVHSIGNGSQLEVYTLDPCDVAFEAEYAPLEQPSPLEKDGATAASIVTEVPETGASGRLGFWEHMPYDELSTAERLKLVSHWAAVADPGFMTGLVELVATFQGAAPAKSVPTLPKDITPAEMEIYRAVAAAISRERRAGMTPEQAAHENKQGVRRVAAFRERMTPEQRVARNKVEAERIRQKRALAKSLQP